MMGVCCVRGIETPGCVNVCVCVHVRKLEAGSCGVLIMIVIEMPHSARCPGYS